MKTEIELRTELAEYQEYMKKELNQNLSVSCINNGLVSFSGYSKLHCTYKSDNSVVVTIAEKLIISIMYHKFHIEVEFDTFPFVLSTYLLNQKRKLTSGLLRTTFVVLSTVAKKINGNKLEYKTNGTCVISPFIDSDYKINWSIVRINGKETKPEINKDMEK